MHYPENKYMDLARKEIGDTSWNTEKGATAGAAVGVLILVLMFGLDDFDNNTGIGYVVVICVFGLGGFFFGRKVEDDHYQKVLKRARELQQKG